MAVGAPPVQKLLQCQDIGETLGKADVHAAKQQKGNGPKRTKMGYLDHR
jgi:hypothetical protein